MESESALEKGVCETKCQTKATNFTQKARLQRRNGKQVKVRLA